jgi:hypothetical protein
VSALGRTADRLAGVLRGGLDRLTGTSYQAEGWPRPVTSRELQAITRQDQGKPARTAYERDAYADGVFASFDGKTWIGRRGEIAEADRLYGPEPQDAPEAWQPNQQELDAMEADWEQRAADYWGGEGPDFEAAAVEGVTPEQLAAEEEAEEARDREWRAAEGNREAGQ